MAKRIKLDEWLKQDGNNQNRLSILSGKPRGAINKAVYSVGGHFVRINSEGKYFVLPMCYWEAFD